ncbi:hypothetical protein O181_036629 [Austropuccinia psidii MF-1]|uniref:Uncharacterized protein n=1 Tax=Austropuccinia psidii MF-1 TaxID=1389203 RepID=A0A9Q3HBR0_9BASI|nr:hypothetical protein [Austropuccinia psidii MF-1]
MGIKDKPTTKKAKRLVISTQVIESSPEIIYQLIFIPDRLSSHLLRRTPRSHSIIDINYYLSTISIKPPENSVHRIFTFITHSWILSVNPDGPMLPTSKHLSGWEC